MKARRFLSIFISVLMIAAMFGPVTTAKASAAWDGTTKDTSWYTDDISIEYYRISTGAELAGLAQLVNAGNTFKGKTIIVTADIDLGSKNWMPIGTSLKPFNGTFDGGGFDILGLSISSVTLKDVGLFGYTETNAIIKNTGLLNVSITSTYTADGNGGVGSIIGYNNGIIMNCHASGTASNGTLSSAGGIAGRMDQGAIYNCCSSVACTGYLAGGITGRADEGGFANCYATGLATGTMAGGLFGGIGTITAKNCYWNLDKTGTAYGRNNATDTNNLKNLNALTASQIQGTASASITYFNSADNLSSTATASSLSEPFPFLAALNGGKNVVSPLSDGTPASGWSGEHGAFPLPVSSAMTLIASENIGSEVGTAKIAASPLFSGDHLVYSISDTLHWPDKGEEITGLVGYTSGMDLSVSTGKYLCLYELDTNNKAVAFYQRRLTANDIRQDIDLPGSGTAGDPFTVSSVTELGNLATMVNTNGKTYAGKIISLTRDIDLLGVSNWTPISDGIKLFSGTFDGKGYTIRNMTITSGGSDAGLFGCVYYGAVNNLTLINTNMITGTDTYNSGAITGELRYSSIVNCRVSGSINSAGTYGDAGGIAGYQTGGSIINSLSTADITCTANNCAAGGIAGCIDKGKAQNCYATGNVTVSGTQSYTYSGGITGNTVQANIINCFATGDVSSGVYAGGIVGYSGSGTNITNSYAAGAVAASASGGKAGGLTGASNADTIQAAYWNSDAAQTVYGAVQSPKIGKGNDSGSTANGMTLADMQKESFITTLNGNISTLGLLDAAAWKQSADANSGLPYLTGIGSIPEISAAASAGSAIGSTKITATASTGNSFKYLLSSSGIEAPIMGDTVSGDVPAAKDYTSDADIGGVKAGQTIGLYEVDTGGVIKGFKLITLASGNIKKGSVPEISATVLAGSAVGSAKITASAAAGNTFKILVSSSVLATPLEEDNISTAAPGAKNYTSGADIGGVKAGQIIGLYEVNASGTIKGFKLITLVSGNIKKGSVPTISATVSAGSAIGSAKITASAAAGNTFKILVSASVLVTPAEDDNISTVSGAKNYTSGADIGGVKAGQYIGLYEVNASGTIKGFKLFTLTSGNIKTFTAPGSLKAVSATYNSIKLTWSPVNGAAGYDISRASTSAGTYKVVGTSTAANFTNVNLTTGTTYYYKVKAYRLESGKKMYSSDTSPVSAKPVPAVPGSFKAVKASSSSIRLSWNLVSGASGYQIYRATSSSGKFTVIKTTGSKSYVNKGLKKNKMYFYKVCAYRTVNGKKICGPFTTVKSAKPY